MSIAADSCTNMDLGAFVRRQRPVSVAAVVSILMLSAIHAHSSQIRLEILWPLAFLYGYRMRLYSCVPVLIPSKRNTRAYSPGIPHSHLCAA